jgi:hypothetical protein
LLARASPTPKSADDEQVICLEQLEAEMAPDVFPAAAQFGGLAKFLASSVNPCIRMCTPVPSGPFVRSGHAGAKGRVVDIRQLVIIE